jgi:hypothetical protein
VGRACGTHGREESIRFRWESQNERETLGKPRCRWDEIRMVLRNVGVEWIQLTRDTDPWSGSCEHGDEPSGSGAT